MIVLGWKENTCLPTLAGIALSNKTKLKIFRSKDLAKSFYTAKKGEIKDFLVPYSNSPDKMVSKGGFKIPLYEFDYTVNEPYEESILFAPIDDMYCSLGDFNCHLSISGTIKFDDNEYKINIKNVGIHIQDKFNYEGDQNLGLWNILDNKIKKTTNGVSRGENFFEITNESFREYREITKMGGDFTIWSDKVYYSTNDNFVRNYIVPPNGIRLLTY